MFLQIKAVIDVVAMVPIKVIVFVVISPLK